MDIIVKLSAIGIDQEPISEGDIPQEVLTDIFHKLNTEFQDRTADKEAYLCEIVERDDFLFGVLEPVALRARACGWNQEIKEEFLRCVEAICKVSVNGKLPNVEKLQVDTPLTNQMKHAAMELDNAWSNYASHAVYIENSQGFPYFRTVLEQAEFDHIIAHPEEYAIVTVAPKS